MPGTAIARGAAALAPDEGRAEREPGAEPPPGHAVRRAAPLDGNGGARLRVSAGSGPEHPSHAVGNGPVAGAMVRIGRVLAAVAGTLLGVLALLICLDIASRQTAGFSMPWSLDVAEYLLYLITFLAAPWVLTSGGHITVDLVVTRLAPPARRRAYRSANAVGAVASLLLFWFACRVWWRSFSEGTLVYETLVFPEWWLFSAAPPVFLLLAAIFGHRVARPHDAGASAGPGPGRSGDAL